MEQQTTTEITTAATPIGVTKTPTILLTKFLAQAGLCSRRSAVELLQSGTISVNNFVITDVTFRMRVTDTVRHNKKVIKPEPKVYILMNKPRNYVTTVSDPDRCRTVIDLLSSTVKQRVYPVGRLDKDTTGLLLLTNDGEMAEKLAHPRGNVKKIYHVELEKPIEEADFKKIQQGVRLVDGRIKVDRIYYLPDKPKSFVGVELHSGKNRIVRRIFEHLRYYVAKLDRVAYAGLTKRNLAVGQFRVLKSHEIAEFTGIDLRAQKAASRRARNERSKLAPKN